MEAKVPEDDAPVVEEPTEAPPITEPPVETPEAPPESEQKQNASGPWGRDS